MGKRSCMVDKGSSMVENRSCVVNKGSSLNNRGSFNNWSSLDNWSSFNHRGSWDYRGSSVVEAMVVSIGKTIVISKRMRVSNQWVVINKGAVSLTMSSNTAVVVSIGISISFSLTTLTCNNGCCGRSKRSRGKSSGKSSLQGAASFCDTVMGGQSDNWGHWGNRGNRSNMMDKWSSMKKRSSMNFMRNYSWSFNNSFNDWCVYNRVSNWEGKGSRGNKRSNCRSYKRSSSW